MCIGVDLCIDYRIDPREFVEIYMAYVLNNLNGAEPTDSTLDEFERKELASYKSKATSNVNTFHKSINEYDDNVSDDDDNDVMGAYICTTPKVNQKKN